MPRQFNKLSFIFSIVLIFSTLLCLTNAHLEQQQTSIIQTELPFVASEQSDTHTATDESDDPIEQQGDHKEEQQKHEEHHSKIPGVGLSIVFIFGSLLYGALLKLFSRIIGIPYNPLLLISGILLGINFEHLGIIGQATHLISGINPNAILAIFLPCLIFQSAFKTEWHTFKKMVGQSLIMGVFSSMVSACLIMVIMKVFIDQHNIYTWQNALMLGSMLTCTDILSFMLKLKRGGVPQKLTSLIEGESLFNYCTCVLIFQFMQYISDTKEEIDTWVYFQLFFEQVFGGIVFGVITGFIAVYCIKRMIYDGILVVTLLAIFCYSIYLVAQFSKLRISGIISLAIFGLYMNAFGKTWLFGETEEYVATFWSYLVYVAETSIFMIAGVLVGANVIHFQSGEIDIYRELIVTIYIYICVVFIRFLSIGVFYRYLRKMGDGLNWKQIVVLTFAGLKGAIGISLAMLVFKNSKYDVIVSSLIMMHVTCNSLLTLVINGTTTNLIVKMLGVSSLKRVEYKFFQEYLHSFVANILERKEKLREEKDVGYEMIQWEEIEKQIGLPDYDLMVKATQELVNNKQYVQDSKFEKSQLFKLQNVLKDYHQIPADSIAELLDEKNAQFDLQVEYRKRFLKDLIAKYWQFHENNFTTPAALMLLIQSANFDLDKETEEIQSWNWIKNQISFVMRIFSELMKLTLVNELAKSHLFEYVSFCYDVVSSYIKANEQVREQLEDFYDASEKKNKEEQSHILRNILKESEENQKEAEFFLANYLEPSFPQIEKEVKTRKVSFFILHTFKDVIDKNNENGQLEPNEYQMLNHIIDSKSLELNLFTPRWEETNLFQILKENPLFRLIPEPVLQLISNQIGQEYTFDANERIMDNSEIAKYFYFVKKGGCTVQFTNEKMVYKEPMLAGQVFGFESLCTNTYHSKATANTMAEIVQVKKSLMTKIFTTFPQFEEQFWKEHIFESYKMFVRKDDITFSISHVVKEELMEMIDHFKLERLEPGEIDCNTKDMIFIRGFVEILNKDEGSAAYLKSNKVIKEGDRRSARSLNTSNVQIAAPFAFMSRSQELSIRIRDPSYFLIGELDYSIFDRISSRMSRGVVKGKSAKKMNSFS